jgi:hypothetical protein
MRVHCMMCPARCVTFIWQPGLDEYRQRELQRQREGDKTTVSLCVCVCVCVRVCVGVCHSKTVRVSSVHKGFVPEKSGF